MKKNLVMIVMIGLMLSVTGFVMADGQDLTVIVSSTSSVSINPTVDFGTISPGTPNSEDDAITFTADVGSNENMTISVTSVTGIFADNIDVSPDGLDTFASLESFTDVLGCVVVDGLCTYIPIILDAKLDVPLGTPAGIQDGVITYLIVGTPP